MKYCARYNKSIDKHLQDFDEVTIKYDVADRNLVKFLKKHSAQTVNILILDPSVFCAKKGWNLINAIAEQEPDLHFKIQINDTRPARQLTDPELEIIRQLKVPFFFGDRITCFEELNYFLSFCPSDVYLAEEICFDLKRARKVCAAVGTRIRAYANVAQSAISATNPIIKFFIRPEDVSLYEAYIDVLEFWGTESRQHSLLNIYKKEVWFGNLNDLILDFKTDLDSRRLLPMFGAARLNCQQSCLKGSSCRICYKLSAIANITLKEKNIYIKYPKQP